MPGASSSLDPLSGVLQSGQPQLLRYRVRISNGSGRSAGESEAVFAASGAAPAPVLDLRVTSRPRGAAINWEAVPGAEVAVVLLRSEQPTATPGTAPSAGTPASPASPRRKSGSPFRLKGTADAAGTPAAEVHLAAGPPGSDPGGVLDTTAPFGPVLTYRAERVRTVVLDGQTVTLRSEATPAVTATLRDSFPPAAPAGLLAADGSRSAQGSSPPRPAVDLSWQPGGEPDLAGYLVERSESGRPGGATEEEHWRQLTALPIIAPAYQDRAVKPGLSYRYRILAVDNMGNRSVPSSPADITPAP